MSDSRAEQIQPEPLAEELLSAYDASHARILGGLLDLVAKGLAVLPTVKLERCPAWPISPRCWPP